jgi:hypothetical protein
MGVAGLFSFNSFSNSIEHLVGVDGEHVRW